VHVAVVPSVAVVVGVLAVVVPYPGGGVVGSATPSGQCQWSSCGVHVAVMELVVVVVGCVVVIPVSVVVDGYGSQCPSGPSQLGTQVLQEFSRPWSDGRLTVVYVKTAKRTCGRDGDSSRQARARCGFVACCHNRVTLGHKRLPIVIPGKGIRARCKHGRR